MHKLEARKNLMLLKRMLFTLTRKFFLWLVVKSIFRGRVIDFPSRAERYAAVSNPKLSKPWCHHKVPRLYPVRHQAYWSNKEGTKPINTCGSGNWPAQLDRHQKIYLRISSASILINSRATNLHGPSFT